MSSFIDVGPPSCGAGLPALVACRRSPRDVVRGGGPDVRWAEDRPAKVRRRVLVAVRVAAWDGERYPSFPVIRGCWGRVPVICGRRGSGGGGGGGGGVVRLPCGYGSGRRFRLGCRSCRQFGLLGCRGCCRGLLFDGGRCCCSGSRCGRRRWGQESPGAVGAVGWRRGGQWRGRRRRCG